MSTFEIILILLGIIIFAFGYFLPTKKEPVTENAMEFSEEQMKAAVEKSVTQAQEKIGDIVEETITYAMEKTERSMDRVTNEKMMAINEYSDTVLEEINKNHKEVVFLYDMLNDKHENLKSTVSEAAKTASEVKQTVKDVEITAKEVISAHEMLAEKEVTKEAADMVPGSVEEETSFEPMHPQKITLEAQPEEAKKPTRKPRTSKKAAEKEINVEKVEEVDMHFAGANTTGGRNSNERILQLHKAGKSNMAIAKELGLGIGEVKLVIDLFEGV